MDLPPALIRLFQAHRPHGPLPAGASSVLVTFIDDGGRLSFLFTRRTKTMSSFAGQLSFPGGRIDPTDADPLATALRETQEEIGLPRAKIRVLGHFTELMTPHGTLVVCYAGVIGPQDVPLVPTSPREVDEILAVPIDTLLRPGDGDASTDPHVYRARSYEARTITTDHSPNRTLHYWTLDNDAGSQTTVLWGLTAEIVSRVLTQAYDWTPPTAARIVTTLADLQP